MRAVKLGSLKAYYVKVEEGENPLTAIVEAAEKLEVGFAMIQGIGGFENARIGVFHGTGYTAYDVKPEPGHILEVASLSGNVIIGPDGKHYPHLHVVLAARGDKVYAGHLLEARVKPFLEVFLLQAGEAPLSIIQLFRHRWE